MMSEPVLSAAARDTAAKGFAEVAAEFRELLGGAPTLAEFLAVLGWAVPADSDATDGTFPLPLEFTVRLRGNKRYRAPAESRVGDLDDNLYVETSDLAVALLDRLRAESGEPVTPQGFASAVLEVLRTGRIDLADVAPENIQELVAKVAAKRVAKPPVGTIVAIPAAQGGYHGAVVVARNRFGTALGLFNGISTTGRLTEDQRRAPKRFPVYTGDDLVKKGEWPIVGHDEGLLELFPANPEIYHKPSRGPDVDADTGQFGAAETADTEALRLIDADEAAAVGLANGQYRAVYLPRYLRKRLDEGTVPG